MSNTSDKLRNITESILFDLFEVGMDAQEVGMPSFDMLKTSGYIDRKLSVLTALISEHYYPKEFMVFVNDNFYWDKGLGGYLPTTTQHQGMTFKATDELLIYWEENKI